jgi:hypothetical protein
MKTKPFWTWMGLVLFVALGVVVVRKPAIISDFFTGYSKLVGAAISGG